MKELLRGRVAIVTGAGSGLGRAHALALATAGAHVVVNDLTETAEIVAAEINETGGSAFGFVGSVTDEASISALAAKTIERWGRIDILVNNAGILRDKSFAKMSLDDFRLILDVHFMGSVICTKAVWPHMQSQNYGRIVFTTSSSGLYGNFGQENYGAAKMALVGLMRTLSLEGMKFDIRVNCLAPSAATRMTENLYPPEILTCLSAEHVSPGIVALAMDAAPAGRVILAGAGNFATANITMTRGLYIEGSKDVAEKILARFDEVMDREIEWLPGAGMAQHQMEVSQAMAALGLNKEFHNA